MRRLRVLIVTPQFPFPPTWGFGIRVYQLARHLAHRHDLTMLSYGRAEQLADVPGLEAGVGTIRVVVRPEPAGVSKRLLQLRSMPSSTPFQVRQWHSPEMQGAIDSLLAPGAFDVVLLESSHLCAFDYPSAAKVILDEHNIEYELLQRMQETERSPVRRFFNRLEYRKFRPLEQAAWRSVDGLVVTSEREAPIVRGVAPSSPVVVAPNAVDAEFFQPGGATVEPDTIVFTGLMSYRPNLDAVEFFVHQVLPIVERSRPGVRVTVVGDGSPYDLGRLRRKNVILTGKVLDVRPYLDEAAVVIVPIRMGGGTRLKVVEALSMAKAVVSTSVGCEGLRVVHGEHLLVADDAEAFATCVEDVLDDPSRALELGRAGRDLMVDEYSWERSVDRLDELFSALLPVE